jgi:hypothetical protein
VRAFSGDHQSVSARTNARPFLGEYQVNPILSD